MTDSIVYDKAKWHYGGDYPEELPHEQAFVHTGMFLGWLIDRDLYSDFFAEESEDLITAFKNREKTGAQVYKWFDGVLSDEMLSDEGNAFAQDYYLAEGRYLQDYDDLLCDGLPSLYHVQDTWENYAKLKAKIDERYVGWKNDAG